MKQVLLFIVLSIALIGCSSAPKVERVDVEEIIDLSGQWNDTDAMMVAQEMVADSLGRSWYDQFLKEHQRNPVVIVGPTINRSHEHINADIMTKYLERELLNSGKVIFVASSEEREAVRAEREDQQRGYTSPETAKQIGRERGADLIMLGSINSIKDEIRGQYVMMYQVNLELVNLETNDKVWIGQKQIKKKVSRSRFSL